MSQHNINHIGELLKSNGKPPLREELKLNFLTYWVNYSL